MKIISSIAASSIAALFLCASVISTGNASVINGDFETGTLNPWFQDRITGAQGEDWNVSTLDAHTGTFSATNTGNRELRQNFTAVSTASITEFSFWAKHLGNGSAMFVDFFYDDGTSSGFTIDVFEANDWSFFNMTANLDAGKNLNALGFFGNNIGCSSNDCTRTFLDDIVLSTTAQQVPSPASFAFFGLGLIALRLLKK